MNSPTYFKAAGLGYTNLGETAPHVKDIPFTVWAANSDWAAKNRAALTAFARSYKRGVEGSTIPPTSSRLSISW